jgi:hypothetical protein
MATFSSSVKERTYRFALMKIFLPQLQLSCSFMH